MQLYVGTSGYAYKTWKGAFYPEQIPAKEMLRFYGEHFNTVEINNTFYRMPRESVLLDWAGDVPNDFSFVLKASRRITHFKRLQDVGDELDYFLRTSSVLRDRLGPTLFQLPPNFKKDVERLDRFLTALPQRWAAAFEFRHESWFDPEVYRMLEGRAALAVAETDETDDAPHASSVDWGYLRLRRSDYTDAQFTAWATRILSESWKRVYVFFKHEDAGTGPRFAHRFREIFESVA